MVNSIHNSSSGVNASVKSGQNIQTAFNRLSSGLRINSAKDNSAGLAISDRMTSQLRGINQAIRNSNDGISLTQTAEGALSETSSILQRMRELALQSANSTYSAADRQALNDEFSQLQQEIDRISGQTQFNDANILNGEHTSTYQVGSNAGDVIDVTIPGASTEDLAIADISITSMEDAQKAIDAIDGALENISTTRGNLGAVQHRFESTISTLETTSENIAASRSRVTDADYATEVSNLVKSRILQQAEIAMQTQANQSAETILGLLK